MLCNAARCDMMQCNAMLCDAMCRPVARNEIKRRQNTKFSLICWRGIIFFLRNEAYLIHLSKQEEAIASSCLHVATGLAMCNSVQCDLMHIIQYGTVRYHRYDTIRCEAMRCDAMRYDTMRCDAIRYDTMRCDAIYDAIRCDTIRYDKI